MPFLFACSDPDGVEKMYIVIEREGNLIKFVCKRGTSQLEGYHKHLAELLVGTNYSARLAGALITIRNFRYGMPPIRSATSLQCQQVSVCIQSQIVKQQSS